jgi:hypothetical protein
MAKSNLFRDTLGGTTMPCKIWRELPLQLAVTAALILSAVAVCNATPTIYYAVNRTVGTGTVTGFIATDGTLGVLGAPNIVDWNISLLVGSDSYDLLGPLSGNNSTAYIDGIDLTATPTQLLFNFSANDFGYFLLQYSVNVHDGFHFYCDAIVLGRCPRGETDSPQYFTDGQTVERSGNIVIAGEVPEPGTCALLFTGVGLLIGKRKALETFRSKRC